LVSGTHSGSLCAFVLYGTVSFAVYFFKPFVGSGTIHTVHTLVVSNSMISSARVASRKASSRNVNIRGTLSSSSTRRFPGAAAASVAGVRNALSRQSQHRFYTTERILELRTGKKKKDQPKVLYDPSRETENCGVGMIASLKSIPSRDIVEKADEMLVRMAHRGGCGCDPASGDGSGT
jgi:hypothetical protein